MGDQRHKYRTKYENITFAEGYNKPFAEFEKEFENHAAFKKVPHKQKKAKMKAVHSQVLKDTKEFAKQKTEDAKAIEVKAEEVKETPTKNEENGNATKTATTGEEPK